MVYSSLVFHLYTRIEYHRIIYIYNYIKCVPWACGDWRYLQPPRAPSQGYIPASSRVDEKSRGPVNPTEGPKLVPSRTERHNSRLASGWEFVTLGQKTKCIKQLKSWNNMKYTWSQCLYVAKGLAPCLPNFLRALSMFTSFTLGFWLLWQPCRLRKFCGGQ